MRSPSMACALIAIVALSSCSEISQSTSSPVAESTVSQGLDNNCFTDPSQCLRPTVNKVTCYKPGTATTVANGYSYSDSSGTNGFNGFSGTNHGRHIVYIPPTGFAPTYASLSLAQQRDIIRFMNNLAMSNIAAVPSTNAILNHYAIQPARGGYKKWYPVDSAYRQDYLVYWNAAENCAYIMTNLPGWQGAIANIYTKYNSMSADAGLLGLPTSNWVGNAWGVSWQRFTNGYITSRSTGYGDMTYRAYYVGGTSIEDQALAGRYSKFFDYPGSSGVNSYPLTQDPQCSNSNTVNPTCWLGKTGRFTKALGPNNYVQTIMARVGQAAAYSVGGELGNRWRAAYGATQPWNGALGFPKSEEFWSGGLIQQNFDKGYMTWTGVASIYIPASCSSLCPTSSAATTCWDSYAGSSTTCGAVTCSASCNWGSETFEYCYDGTEGNTNSTCGEYGVSKLNSMCLLEPTHAGCNPLKQSNQAQHGICNDGTIVAFVPDVATRPWSALTSTSGGERERINTLMNNAASLIGCTLSQNYWPVTDVNLDPANQDATTAAYVKPYMNAANDTSCGEVYFNRALGCAFPIAKTDTPVGIAKVATEAKIYEKWNTSRYTHGLPSSLPQRAVDRSQSTFDIPMAWQRFKNSYFTYRLHDDEAYFLGGNIYGSGEGASLAGRYGQEFDYYSPKSRYPSLKPTTLWHDTACIDSTSNLLYGTCNSNTIGLVGVSTLSTYFIALDDDTATRLTGEVQTKYFELAGGVSPQYVDSTPSPNPSATSIGVGLPVGEPTSDGSASYQEFDGGKIYTKPGQPAKLVANTMAPAYEMLGGPDGDLGYPVEDTPSAFGDNLDRTQLFEYGRALLPAAEIEPTIMPDVPAAPTLIILRAQLTDDPDGLPVRLMWGNRYGTTSTTVFWKQMPSADSPKPSTTDTGWTVVGGGASPVPFPPVMDTFQHSGAATGTQNCYYVSANNDEFVSNVACVITRSPRPDANNVSLVRVELRVKVADVSDAGTDDTVQVRLNLGNLTKIDRAIDDFERGSDQHYFLLPFGAETLDDISMIRIEVNDDDAVCIEKIELYVNRPAGRPLQCTNENGCMFHKFFGNTNNTCKWVENSNTTTKEVNVTWAELRASALWNQNPKQFLGFNEVGLKAAIEGLIGHYTHGKRYKLKEGEQIELERVTTSEGEIADTVMHIHAKLKSFWFITLDARTNVYLDPQYDCSKPRPDQITSTKVRINKPTVESSLPLVLGFYNLFWWPVVNPALEWYINIFVSDRVRNISASPGDDLHFCFPPPDAPLLPNGLAVCNNGGNYNFDPLVRTPCMTVAAELDGPPDSGYVDTLPASNVIRCGSPPYTPPFSTEVCVFPYSSAAQVYLHATPFSGYMLHHWSVDLVDGAGGCIPVSGAPPDRCYVNTQDNPVVSAVFSYSNFQSCFDKQTTEQGLQFQPAVLECCLKQRIATSPPETVCGTTAAACVSYLGSNLTSTATQAEIQAACDEYIIQLSQ